MTIEQTFQAILIPAVQSPYFKKHDLEGTQQLPSGAKVRGQKPNQQVLSPTGSHWRVGMPVGSFLYLEFGTWCPAHSRGSANTRLLE